MFSKKSFSNKSSYFALIVVNWRCLEPTVNMTLAGDLNLKFGRTYPFPLLEFELKYICRTSARPDFWTITPGIFSYFAPLGDSLVVLTCPVLI